MGLSGRVDGHLINTRNGGRRSRCANCFFVTWRYRKACQWIVGISAQGARVCTQTQEPGFDSLERSLTLLNAVLAQSHPVQLLLLNLQQAGHNVVGVDTRYNAINIDCHARCPPRNRFGETENRPNGNRKNQLTGAGSTPSSNPLQRFQCYTDSGSERT